MILLGRAMPLGLRWATPNPVLPWRHHRRFGGVIRAFAAIARVQEKWAARAATSSRMARKAPLGHRPARPQSAPPLAPRVKRNGIQNILFVDLV